MFKKKEKLTQEELASKLHVSPQVISKWENGRNFPKDPDILINISNILDVSLEELLYGEYKTKENKDIITNNFNKEYKNNYNKYKKVLIISIITILILIICFLIFIYLNNIKNKIKQYKITSDGEFNISGNILVTNTLTTLFMNKIEDNNISYITLYYKKDNNEYLICSGSNMTINIIDYNDYKEYNLKEFLNNNAYLRIGYNDNTTKDIKLIFTEIYKNDQIFSDEIKNNNDNIIKTDNRLDKLIDLGFKKESESDYIKEFDNGNLEIFVGDNDIHYSGTYFKEKEAIIIDAHDNSDTMLVMYNDDNKKVKVTEINKCENGCKDEYEYAGYIYYVKSILNEKRI